MNQPIDYKSLLHRYMAHVCECEGIDFTDRLNEPRSSTVEFTPEEAAELRRMSAAPLDTEE